MLEFLQLQAIDPPFVMAERTNALEAIFELAPGPKAEVIMPPATVTDFTYFPLMDEGLAGRPADKLLRG